MRNDYVLKEEWFAGNSDVTDEITKMLSAPMEQQPSLELPAQTDVSALDDLKLAKRKTQLSSSITKTRNMLSYQSIRKGEQPMDPTMMQKHDIYIQLNLNGSTINVPTDKWDKLKDSKLIADAIMQQEITEAQAEEIMEG